MITAGVAAPASAQSADAASLMALEDSALEGELTTRYEAGLAGSLNERLIAADDPRYLWALETKAQCAIALGFMESSTRDATSIGNCARAYNLMNRAPAPPPVAAVIPPPPPPMRRPDQCDDAIAGMVFFEFDSAVVSPEAGAVLNTVAQNIAVCGWRALSVVGHTDQAGSNPYNDALSRARADAVAAALRNLNTSGARIDVGAQGENNPRVPEADGTRNPQNRRVEILAE